VNRPRVVTFNLASVDGRLTLAPGVNLMAGDERWNAVIKDIGDPYVWARETHDPEVLLEGSGSFLSPAHAELVGAEPGEPLEGEHFLPPSVVDVPDRRWFAVVDGGGRVDLTFTEWPDPAWAGWHALVLTSHAAPAEHLARLKERGIPYLVVGRAHVALEEALGLLADRLDVRTVVCTGGGRLGGALLRQHLVDEVDLELLPWAIGGRGTPALFDAPPLADEEWPTPLSLIACESLGDGRVRLRYRVLPTHER
jgi:2,5-diamino-6-(ribosylamino)-4(3H)-pyrimidinone 5'-phosphate reductase